MKERKLLINFLIILFLSSVGFSIGVYDNFGEYNYYIHNPNPTVNVTIKSPMEVTIIKSAEFEINGEVKTLENFQEITLNPGDMDKTVSIPLSDFGVNDIMPSDDMIFKLLVTKADGVKIRPKGDPVDFNIILDTSKPNLISPLDKNLDFAPTSSNKLNLVFNEKISKLSIVNHGDDPNNAGVEILKLPKIQSSFEREYTSSFSESFEEGALREGPNNLELIFDDLAENENRDSILLNYRGEDLELELMTTKTDSSLKYFYDPAYNEILENKIHFSEDTYTLKVKSSKKAKCYFSNRITEGSGLSFDDVVNKEEFTTSDNLVHTFEMSGQTRIWVACQNFFYDDDVAYLNDFIGMSNSLIYLKKYSNDYEITSILPDTIVSSNILNLDVKTSEPAVCVYEEGSSGKITFTNISTDYKSHIKPGIVVEDGTYNYKITCFDKLYSVKTKTREIIVDIANGPKLVKPRIHYTDSPTKTINLVLSEDVLAKYSSQQGAYDNFGNLTTLLGTGLTRTLTPSGIQAGENEVYIYFEKEIPDKGKQLYSDILKIVYDPNPPKLSDLKFVNNGYESDYLGSESELSFKVTTESLIPIKSYVAELKMENSSMFSNSSSGSGDIVADMNSATKLVVYAVSEIDKKSNTLEKIIKIDLNEPIIKFIANGNERDISCVDAESGCSQILYGFSDSPLNCIPTLVYDKNNSIDVGDNLNLCVKAIDNAGNEANELQVLSAGFISEDFIGDLNETLNETEEIVGEEEEEEETPDEHKQTDIKRPAKKDDNTLVIVAIVTLVLGSIGGGGYYSYRKGYLDKQLEKFGIKRGDSKSASSQAPKKVTGTGTTGQKFTISNPITKAAGKKKSKYDRDLNKLNTFLEDTLNKGDDVFGKFEGVDKGKVEGYEDTLIKPKKKEKFSLKNKETAKKESFDTSSFESKSSTGSIENEAEEFEKYFKSKKKTTSKKE